MDQALAQGQIEEQQFRDYGASDEQINDWKQKKVAEFQKYGAADDQINKYFGIKEPDTAGMKAYAQKNIEAFHESRKAADGTPQKEAATFGEAFDAGWESSVTGLYRAGHLPDTVLPEHAGFFHRLVSEVGQLTGDIPAMLAGSFGGSMFGAAALGTAGSIIPGVGTLGGIAAGSEFGAAAGTFAAPAGMRKLLMDHYEKGDIKDPQDFLTRLAGATWEAAKAGAVGVLTAGAGKYVRHIGGDWPALAAELTTMTTAGAAMEGHLPTAEEFQDGAVLLGGFHAVGKLRNIYASTGQRPAEIVEKANSDPALKQEISSENQDMPKQAAPQEKEPLPETDLDRALAGKGKGGGESEPPIETLTGGEPPSKPPEPQEVAAARERVNSRLAEKKVSGDPSMLSKEWWQEKKDQFYTAFIDRLSPLNEAVKAMASDNLPASINPYVLARNFPGWKGKAESFLSVNRNALGKIVGEGGTLDWKTGKVNGESLENVLKDVKPGEQSDFMAYSLSRRALERGEADKATGIKLDDAKTVVGADHERFGAIFDRMVSWNDRVMAYAKDAGLISKEVFNRINKGSKDYLPLMREQDFDEFTGKTKGRDGGLYQEMEGSNRKILNPVEQMMRNAMRVVRAADLNRVRETFGDLVDENGFGIAEKIERPTGADNEVSFKRDGELQAYRVKSEYAEAIKSLNADPGKTALWARMLMAPAGWLRTGTVLNPDFIVRHGERGLFVSAVQSKSLGGAFSAPFDVARSMYQNVMAIGSILRNDESYQAYVRSGGAQSTIFGIEDYLGKQNFWDLNRDAGNFMSKAWNTFISPLEYMAHLSDNIARVAEFKRAGGVGGDLNATVEAAFRSREVTLDYMRAGAQIKAMSSFVPFMNIGIQGIDRMARGWKEDPVGFTARASAALTIPTLINWAANRNDSRYKDAPAWEKDLYWIIPTNKWEKAANLADAMSRPEDLRRLAADGGWEVNNGTTLRVSKPFELGLLFATVPERLLNRFADHDPRAAGELVSTLLHGALPNVLPTALTPLLEQGTNKNFFTGRPVVSSHAEGLLPEYQYNEYTSTVARQLGKVIAYVPGLRDIGPKDAKLASPQVIDNYIHDWSGTLGQYALQVIDKAEQGLGIVNRPPPPTATLADIPIIKAFIARHPSQNVQPIQDFYDDYEKASRLNATVTDLLKKGDQDSVAQAMKLQGASQGDMLRLTEVKKSLGTLAKTINGINDASGLKPDEKRQLMDGAYYQMSMIARAGNKIMDQYRKQVNAQNSGRAQ